MLNDGQMNPDQCWSGQVRIREHILPAAVCEMPTRLLDWMIDENEIFQVHMYSYKQMCKKNVDFGIYGDSGECGSLLYILAPGGLYKEPPAISPRKPDGEI